MARSGGVSDGSMPSSNLTPWMTSAMRWDPFSLGRDLFALKSNLKGIICDSAQITLDRRRHIQFNGAQGEGRTWHTRHPESTTAKAIAL